VIVPPVTHISSVDAKFMAHVDVVMASASSDDKEQLDNLRLLPAVIDVSAKELPFW
jgi:hypothetical protein